MGIFAAILETLKNEPTRKTAIVYKANLNFSRVNRFLADLQRLGYISVVNTDGKEVYVLTPKGSEFLADYNRLVK